MAPVRVTRVGTRARSAWEQAHIDSWTADRIPRLDLQGGEVRGTARSASRTPGSSSKSSRPTESIDEELDQASGHTVTVRVPGSGLPRKEVIQPQLPLRLPCYDFVPVISPTLGVCLPCGLAQRLQVLPTSMT